MYVHEYRNDCHQAVCPTQTSRRDSDSLLPNVI